MPRPQSCTNSDGRPRPSTATSPIGRRSTELFETASGLGTIVSVIHTAGVSPSMGDADYVMRTNALGTVNVNEVFYETAGEGAAIVNVASMAAHMLPEELIPTRQFPRPCTTKTPSWTDMTGGMQHRFPRRRDPASPTR